MKILYVILVGSWLATSAIAFANGEVPASAAATPTATPSASATPSSANSETANDDLSQYKTADELWKHYVAVMQKNSGNISQSKPQLDAIAAEFEKRYPSDPRRLDVEMNAFSFWELPDVEQAHASEQKVNQAIAKLEVMRNASDARTSLKQVVFWTIWNIKARTIHDEASYESWNQAVTEAVKKSPEFANGSVEPESSQTFPVEDELNYQRAHAILGFDEARGIEVLQKLAETAKDPLLAAGAKGSVAVYIAQNQKEQEEDKAAEKKYLHTQPDWKFTAVDGREVDMTKLRGKVVLVDFWGTGCPPCMAEAPNVVKIYNALHEKGFEIVGIAYDDNKEKLLRVIKEKGMDWPEYFENNRDQNMFKDFIPGIPNMWLVNKKGFVVAVNIRQLKQEQVEKLLAE